MRPSRFFLGGVWMITALSGCHQTPKHTDDILNSAWSPITDSAREKLHTSKPLYCYATLGEPECYHIKQYPLAGRLQGAFVPLTPSSPPQKHGEHPNSDKHHTSDDHDHNHDHADAGAAQN